jgi:hypothetical protein
MILSLGLAVCLVATAATAQQGHHDKADCSCRAPGKRVLLGDTVCLATAEGHRLATCVMNQNVTSWAISKEGCVVSSLEDRAARLPSAALSADAP